MEPVRDLCAGKGMHFVKAECDAVDIVNKRLHCSASGEEMSMAYDKLVIAVGSKPNNFGIEGVEKYGHYLKEAQDARQIRADLLEQMERAVLASDPAHRKELLTFVIVGGGPTGVEFASELTDFIHEDVVAAFPELADDFRVVLLEGGTILTQFDEKLRDHTLQSFRSRAVPIDVQLKRGVTDVDDGVLTLDDGSTMPFGLLVWTAGVKPRSFVSALGLPTEKGRLLTDRCQRVPGADSLYALGDCAAYEEDPLPPTAQVAEQQGAYLASCLNSNSFAKSFEYRHRGMMAYIGRYRALAQLSKDTALKDYSAWVAWRGAYFTKLGSWRARFQVPYDWVKTFIFGRDVSSF
eukprot:PLAT15546.2.p1 GENE.PLAT15546.2~~PLAT15546.2.p1  ORF type:complete len:350 (+),score=142.22 PLAT15546.2:231-1280(+)